MTIITLRMVKNVFLFLVVINSGRKIKKGGTKLGQTIKTIFVGTVSFRLFVHTKMNNLSHIL